jgi:hypothetical protein
MRSLLVVIVDEGIELGLLLQEVTVLAGTWSPGTIANRSMSTCDSPSTKYC